MPLVSVPIMQVRVKDRKLSQIALASIGKDSDKVINDVFEKTSKKIAAKMEVPGKPITYPVKWDSDKQRRYVMWLLRDKLPYQRKGFYVSRWKATKMRGGYQVANLTTRARYIAGNINGDRQSRIHRGRWPVFRKVVDAALRLVPPQIMSELKITFKRAGFRVK